MIGILLFILASVGMTNIIVREYVFEWLRNWINKVFPYSLLNKLFQCETCMGFWVGLFISLMFPEFNIHWFIGGLVSSISNKLINIMIYKF